MMSSRTAHGPRAVHDAGQVARPATGRPPDGVPGWCLSCGLVLVPLLVAAAGAGLLLDVYAGETAFGRNGFRGADLVTLVVEVPVLVAALVAARRGSVRGTLVLLGALAYVTYQYAYVFAYRWNVLFPVYVTLLSLSAFTLTGVLLRTDADRVRAVFDDHAPVRAVRVFLAVVAVALAVMESAQVVVAMVSRDVPRMVTDSGHPTAPVYVMDLGLVVPLLVLAVVLLGRRAPWGFVLAPMLLYKCAAIGLGLLAANVVALAGGGRTDGVLNVVWAVVATGGAVGLLALLQHAGAGARGG